MCNDVQIIHNKLVYYLIAYTDISSTLGKATKAYAAVMLLLPEVVLNTEQLRETDVRDYKCNLRDSACPFLVLRKSSLAVSSMTTYLNHADLS